jgi:hypothetical protein
MAMRDGATLDVDDVFRRAELAEDRKRHGRERLIDLHTFDTARELTVMADSRYCQTAAIGRRDPLLTEPARFTYPIIGTSGRSRVCDGRHAVHRPMTS